MDLATEREDLFCYAVRSLKQLTCSGNVLGLACSGPGLNRNDRSESGWVARLRSSRRTGRSALFSGCSIEYTDQSPTREPDQSGNAGSDSECTSGANSVHPRKF